MKQIAAIFLIALAGCATVHETNRASVHHVVLCWLKDSGNAAQRRQIIDVSRSFRAIPGVLDVQAGEVMASDRKMVDATFDVAVVFSFEDADKLKAYLASPIHQKATTDVLLPIVRKIVVYDFQDPEVSDPVRPAPAATPPYVPRREPTR